MKITVLICSLCLLFTFGTLNAQQEKQEPEVFTCTALLTTTRAAGAAARLTISIDSYTPMEEIKKYIDILKTKGQKGLRKALEKVKRGWIAPARKTRETFSIARSIPIQGGGRYINILKTRSLKFIEFAYSTRSRDYEFTLIQLKLDNKGHGEGVILAGTKIEFNKEGKIVLEHRGIDPITVRNVRQKKKKKINGGN